MYFDGKNAILKRKNVSSTLFSSVPAINSFKSTQPRLKGIFHLKSTDSNQKFIFFTEFASIFSHVRSYALVDDQADAAHGVIKRTIPQHAHLFHVTINDALPLHTFRLFKANNADIVEIEASSGVIACKGFNHYLKYYCNSHVSWNGHRIHLPEYLPDVNVTETSPSRYIYYQNVCTWSYSFAWWQWNDWQRHIDWMALQGMTNALKILFLLFLPLFSKY